MINIGENMKICSTGHKQNKNNDKSDLIIILQK